MKYQIKKTYLHGLPWWSVFLDGVEVGSFFLKREAIAWILKQEAK